MLRNAQIKRKIQEQCKLRSPGGLDTNPSSKETQDTSAWPVKINKRSPSKRRPFSSYVRQPLQKTDSPFVPRQIQPSRFSGHKSFNKMRAKLKLKQVVVERTNEQLIKRENESLNIYLKPQKLVIKNLGLEIKSTDSGSLNYRRSYSQGFMKRLERSQWIEIPNPVISVTLSHQNQYRPRHKSRQRSGL